MNWLRMRWVSTRGLAILAVAGALTLPACTASRNADSDSSLVVTENGAGSIPMSPGRAAAVAAMRAEVAAVNSTPPAESSVEQAIRLSGREEPRSVAEVDAIEAELALIAEQRAGATPGELAALEARAAELRRLAALHGGAVRP
jgi:hypothetical protein